MSFLVSVMHIYIDRGLCIDRADVVESCQKTWNTVRIFHAWRRRLAHMLGVTLRMVPRTLSGAPVGTTDIGNVAVLVMSGQGEGRVEMGMSGVRRTQRAVTAAEARAASHLG